MARTTYWFGSGASFSVRLASNPCQGGYINFCTQTDIEIEFPDLWAQLKVTGTLVKGKDSHVDLVVAAPTTKHILEGRLLFSESFGFPAKMNM